MNNVFAVTASISRNKGDIIFSGNIISKILFYFFILIEYIFKLLDFFIAYFSGLLQFIYQVPELMVDGM